MDTPAPPPQEDERQSQLKLLIAKGKEQGFLTYGEVNDHLPSEIVDPEQIEDIVNMINDMGIPVYEKAPDSESLLMTDTTAAPDEEAVEEATAALASLDAEFGRTTDPVRMYMREMGTVELLTREGEIRIAKRIEEGLEAVKISLANYPGTYDLLRRILALARSLPAPTTAQLLEHFRDDPNLKHLEKLVAEEPLDGPEAAAQVLSDTLALLAEESRKSRAVEAILGHKPAP